MNRYVGQTWRCSKCHLEFSRSRKWEDKWPGGTLKAQQPWIFECDHIHDLRTETIEVDCPEGSIFVYEDVEMDGSIPGEIET